MKYNIIDIRLPYFFFINTYIGCLTSNDIMAKYLRSYWVKQNNCFKRKLLGFRGEIQYYLELFYKGRCCQNTEVILFKMEIDILSRTQVQRVSAVYFFIEVSSMPRSLKIFCQNTHGKAAQHNTGQL